MPFIMLLLPVGPLLQGLCTRIFIVRASVMVIICIIGKIIRLSSK